MINKIGLRGKLKQNYNVAHLTWLKIGGSANWLFCPEDYDDLELLLKKRSKEIDINIIGAGSNILVRDGEIEGVLIRLGRNFNNIQYDKDNKLLSVGAGCLNSTLYKYCLEESIVGFEFLSGIPGTIGGGIAMNAGAYGREFGDIVHSVEAMNFAGERILLSNKDMQFHYRGNGQSNILFLKGYFKVQHGNKNDIQDEIKKIQTMRELTQPIHEKCCGSLFRNPSDKLKAWQLIHAIGAQGKIIGGIQVSTMHSNFIINTGNATSEDVENMIDYIKQKILKEYNIDLKLEVKILGKKLL